MNDLRIACVENYHVIYKYIHKYIHYRVDLETICWASNVEIKLLKSGLATSNQSEASMVLFTDRVSGCKIQFRSIEMSYSFFLKTTSLNHANYAILSTIHWQQCDDTRLLTNIFSRARVYHMSIILTIFFFFFRKIAQFFERENIYTDFLRDGRISVVVWNSLVQLYLYISFK